MFECAGKCPSSLNGDTGFRGEMTLGSRIYGQFASTIPVIWSIGYMVIPDTWSILAGPEADLVSGTHCIQDTANDEMNHIYKCHNREGRINPTRLESSFRNFFLPLQWRRHNSSHCDSHSLPTREQGKRHRFGACYTSYRWFLNRLHCMQQISICVSATQQIFLPQIWESKVHNSPCRLATICVSLDVSPEER